MEPGQEPLNHAAGRNFDPAQAGNIKRIQQVGTGKRRE